MIEKIEGIYNRENRSNGMVDPFSDFTYIIDPVSRNLLITDLNKGNMSVTNDAERVLTWIWRNNQIDLTKYTIKYFDSENNLDFLHINASDNDKKEVISVHF